MTKWTLQITTLPNELKQRLNVKWNDALKDLRFWIIGSLVPALINGGLGLQGIKDTEFFKFVISDDGLSQLGIEKVTAMQLLTAYQKSFTVELATNELTFNFGDEIKLKLGTPHPASGTGQLRIDSWLTWILDGQQVMGYGFLPRVIIPSRSRGAIRLKDPLGGLMLKPGTFGFNDDLSSWEFPVKYQNYDIDWVNINKSKIEDLIVKQMNHFLSRQFKN